MELKTALITFLGLILLLLLVRFLLMIIGIVYLSGRVNAFVCRHPTVDRRTATQVFRDLVTIHGFRRGKEMYDRL